MACKSDWTVKTGRIDRDDDEKRLFFDQDQWSTIDAATARIMPTDHDPGAREAGVVPFIDRYLSGIDYIYASADGSGFLEMDGPIAKAWQQHIEHLRGLYRDGIAAMDETAMAEFGARFADCDEKQQDEVLVKLSGRPFPSPIEQIKPVGPGYGGFAIQSDVGLDFFDALCLHTRQGFYGDPAYGGNRNGVGWTVIGFPGPESLDDTRTCSYSVEHLLVSEYSWPDLLPYLRKNAE
jgi:gluconate 2-dehydrogenase gamma chain